MQEHFNQVVDDLKSSLIKMANQVDEQGEKVIKALETGNINLCLEIKAKDLEIDAYDNLIQAQCENIFALFQPVAVDLRFVMSAMMINNQLERCGDIIVNISKRVKKTSEYNDLIKEAQIIEMGLQAKNMLKNAIDSFVNIDSELAHKVIENDEIVDDLNKRIFKYLVEKMKNEPELIDPCSHLIILSRNLERLADHATNIAKNLIFYVDAQIVAHKNKLNKYKGN